MNEYPVLTPPRGLSLKNIDSFSAVMRLKAAILKGARHRKMLSLSNSRTSLLPHQIEAVDRVVSSGRYRWILADEVGLGKTVEAGLIFKELVLRHHYQRVLVLCPASLLKQWQQEMKGKFDEDFEIADRRLFQKNKQSFDGYNRLIASIDFARSPSVHEALCASRWDIVIIDEAHRMRRDNTRSTRAWQLGRDLSEQSEAFFLLTATPFRGKLEELFYLVQLVDKHLLGTWSDFFNRFLLKKEDGLQNIIRQVLIRNRKVEVGGFTRRFARTVSVELSPEERDFYDSTTQYVKEGYDRSIKEKRPAVGFVMVVYQRLLDSSSHALLQALGRRLEKLEHRLHHHPLAGRPLIHNTDPLSSTDPADTDWLEQLDSQTEEYELEECLKTAENDENGLAAGFQEMRLEILTLRRLLQLGSRIQQDKKLMRLKETLASFKKQGENRFLIFTEFRSTQQYLYDNLPEFNVALFHGGLNRNEKEEAIEAFKSEADILICTEAGGEGRNLQWARILINYDLPWSPLKVEQRIGRLHRFGQKNDVLIVNLTTAATVGERILEVLQQKIGLFESAIGECDDLLGLLESEGTFSKTFRDFATGRKSVDEFEKEIRQSLETAHRGYKSINNLLTPRVLDFDLSAYYRFSKEKRSLDNRFISRYVLQHASLATSDLVINETSLPGRYNCHDRLTQQSHAFTFDAETAMKEPGLDFFALGHPVVEKIIHHWLGDANSPAWLCKTGDGFADCLTAVFTVYSETAETIYCNRLTIDSGLVAAVSQPNPVNQCTSVDIDTLSPLTEENFESLSEKETEAVTALLEVCIRQADDAALLPPQKETLNVQEYTRRRYERQQAAEYRHEKDLHYTRQHRGEFNSEDNQKAGSEPTLRRSVDRLLKERREFLESNPRSNEKPGRVKLICAVLHQREQIQTAQN